MPDRKIHISRKRIRKLDNTRDEQENPIKPVACGMVSIVRGLITFHNFTKK